MTKAIPIYLVDQVTTEVRLATRRMFTARSVLEAATDGQPTLPTPTSCGNTLLVVRLGYDQFERTLLRPLAEKGDATPLPSRLAGRMHGIPQELRSAFFV